MKYKSILVRAIRKAAHLGRKIFYKTGFFLGRVENKADRIILGVDSSFGVSKSVAFEKMYYEKIPLITPVYPALPKRSRKPAVTLLLPTLDNRSFFGGTATAIVVAALAAEKTHKDLRIIQTLKPGQAEIEPFLEREGVPFSQKISTEDISGRSYNVYGYIDIHPDDIFIVSAWWDAHLVDKLPLTKRFIYLIQDFEPIFYNNSDQYVLAESTYHTQNYVALCNTKLMFDFMKNRNYHQVSKGAWFEPAVSRYVKNVGKSKGSEIKKRIFVYGRPNVERNLFFMALNSIEDCFNHKYLDPNEWEVVMAGQNLVPNIELNSGIEVMNLGKMSMEEYVEFTHTVDIAISLMMAPHPNYPTLELASAGAAVVTTRYDVKQDLSKYSKNIIMADISAESISGAIRQAAKLSPDERISNAAQSDIQNSWKQTLDAPLSKVLEQI